MMEFDFVAILVGAIVGAAVVGFFWIRDIAKRELDDEDRFGPY